MAVRGNEVYCDNDVKYRINNKLYTTEQVLEAMKIYEKLDKTTLNLIQEQTNPNFRNRVNEMIRYKIKRIKLRMDGDSNGN